MTRSRSLALLEIPVIGWAVAMSAELVKLSETWRQRPLGDVVRDISGDAIAALGISLLLMLVAYFILWALDWALGRLRRVPLVRWLDQEYRFSGFWLMRQRDVPDGVALAHIYFGTSEEGYPGYRYDGYSFRLKPNGDAMAFARWHSEGLVPKLGNQLLFFGTGELFVPGQGPCHGGIANSVENFGLIELRRSGHRGLLAGHYYDMRKPGEAGPVMNSAMEFVRLDKQRTKAVIAAERERDNGRMLKLVADIIREYRPLIDKEFPVAAAP